MRNLAPVLVALGNLFIVLFTAGAAWDLTMAINLLIIGTLARRMWRLRRGTRWRP